MKEAVDTESAYRRTARKNRLCVGVLFDVRLTPYGDERLARLLRLLRPAPRDWVTKAQRIFLDLSTTAHPRAAETGLTEGDLAELRHALESDALFRQRFDADPIAATQAAGLRELALRLAREMRELVALAERIAIDDVYRAELDADPVATLVAAGMPAATAAPLLQALAVPDDVLAKLPEVVAHQHERPPLKARLLIILLGSTAVVETIRSPARRA
jgi:hypothetical protein